MMAASSKNGGGHSPEERGGGGGGGGSSSPFAVVASAHFESGPPASKIRLPDEDDDDVMETVQEEEWEERRKTTTTTTRNVEKRVQRQLVLEDGEVVDDTGPVITEDATEDTVTKEVVSDQNQRPEGQLALAPPPGEGWVATPGAVVISEKCTKTVKSHDEVEDEIETEEIQHCGDVTNKEAEEHIKGQSDLRELIAHRQNQGLALTKPQKRVVREGTRRRGNKDTVDVTETSKIKDGHVVTETEKTVLQEKYENESAPDSGSSLSDGSVHEATKQTSHNLVHTKDEDLLEYYAVPKGGTLAQGVKIGEGMHVVSEDVHEDRQGNNEEDLSAVERLRRARRPGRRDALTKRPLNYDQEEETRKTETNKWLEHHFGSESGRSEDSFHEQEDSFDKIHSSGGNRITITMSPHPATSEDVPDSSATTPLRRWPRESVQGASTPKAPPPPPPKPERIWSMNPDSPTSPMSPMSPSSSSSFHHHEIQDSELTAARQRLRSTGLNLTEENKENNAPYAVGKVVKSSNRFQNADPTKRSPSPQPVTAPKVSSLKDDVVYSSRFRSGKPKGMAPLAPPEYSAPASSLSQPQSITNVGRSQSFHIQTLPWSSKKTSVSPHKSSPMKEYHSVERLDDLDSRRNYSQRQTYETQTRYRPSSPPEYKPYNEKRSWQTRPTWSPPREPTPPPPPRQSRRSPTNKHFSPGTSPIGKETATQTEPSPIPPPRTKRKKRPKSSYFFGQDNDTSSSYSATVSHNGSKFRHSSYDTTFADNFHSNENKYHTERSFTSKHSPKVERRYKTTKTITPVIVVPYNEDKSQRYRNRDYASPSSNKASWTNTVDPRRRPRTVVEPDRSTTLPRKLSSHDSNHVSFPKKKTYLFGETNSPKAQILHDNRYSTPYRGSMHNISVTQTDTYEQNDYNNRYSSANDHLNPKSSKPVGRSHSFNIQAGKNYSGTLSNGRPLSEISDQKTSTVYGSSPYVNHLRSPNLIATIARTSSTRRSNSNDSNDSVNHQELLEDNKKKRFMKGLLDTAPELFHFIHGEENENSTKKPTENQPRSTSSNRTRPTVDVSTSLPGSSSKSPTYSARVFTFGKSDNNTLTRTSQGMPTGSMERLSSTMEKENRRNSYNNSYSNEDNEHYSSTTENNKKNSTLNSNRRSTFNLKTSGSSLLYSPSFRNQQQEAEESRRSRNASLTKERNSGDFSRASISSGVKGNSPVLIQVRDWNMR